MRFINSAIFLVAVLLFSGFSAFAQESEPVVVDEVVAQVNDGVITLSRVRREMKNAIDSLVQQGKTPAAAKAEIESKQNQLIANLINEELVLQKGKELGIEPEVEAQINQRFVQIMKEQNLKTLDALYKEMERSGVKPDEIRELLRKQFTREIAWQREVDSKVYFGLNGKELKDYYEANRTKFNKPETVVLSEIFLGFAGRDQAAVREKAKQLVAQLRAGADFAKLAVENSDRPDAAQTKGKVGSFVINELNEKLGPAVRATRAGSVTNAIETEEGIEIIRVDERTAASTQSVFDEEQVRRALAYERLPEERKKYMTELRKNSYIQISETYRAAVLPLLNEADTKAASTKPTR